MSLYMLVFMGGTPVGSLIVGAITDRWGAPVALVLTGTVCVLAAAWPRCWPPDRPVSRSI